MQLLGDRREHRRRRELLHRQALAAHRLDELVAAGVDRVDAALTREPLADLRPARAASATNCSQSRLGPAPSTLLVKISHVSPDCSAESSGTSRPLTARADATVADLGVDRVREVDRRRARRQRDDLALRREDEDLVLFEVDLQALHELGRVGRLLLPVDDAAAATTRSSVGLRCSL